MTDAWTYNDVAELSTVIHSELRRAELDKLDTALLVAALRLLANDIERDYLL